MAHFHNNALIGSGGLGGDTQYKIERSLRFNDGDSPSLSRTVSQAGNRRTYTFSFWVKRSELGRDDLYKQGSDPYTMFLFRSDDVFGFDSHNGSLDFDVRTERKFRDLGAWMHIVLAVDTTQATNTNRVKLYVNGVQETLTPQSSGWPDQNYDTFINFTNPNNAVLGNNCNGYLAEFHHIDGQQLAASDFGEYDDNNVWQPKEFTGSYSATVAAPYSGTVPSSTTDVPPAGSYQNGIATAAVLFGGTILTNGQNHIRQDGGGIEWSAAIPLSSGDVAGAQCLYFNNTSAHTIQFKINGSWVDVQQNAQNVIGSTQGQGALITYTATGSANWTGVKATGGSNISVTTVAGIFVNGNLVGENDTVGRNGFFLKFADNSSKAALGTDSSGNNNNWTVNNLNPTGGRNYTSQGSTSGSFYTSAGGAASKMFDGDASTGAFSQTGTATFTFGGSTITASSSLKVRAFKGDASGANVLVNGTDISSLLNAQSGGGYSTVDITSTLGGAPINLANVSMVNAGGGSGNIAQIFVDNVELVDRNDRDNDSLIDTPTNFDASSGNNVGNYCTLNPNDSDTTVSNGNLTITGSGTAFKGARSTIGMSSGKWYMECTITAYSSPTSSAPGIWNDADTSLNTGGGSYGNAYLFVTDYGGNYKVYVNKGSTTAISQSGTISAGDIIGIALDLDNGECYAHINGTYLNSGNSVYSNWPADTYFFGGYEYTSGNQLDFNFGQRPFAYTPRTGHKALCTQNLPDPTIAEGASVFDITLYTGNGSGQTISGLDFSPDWAWIKRRSGSTDHCINDTVRGAGKQLNINQNYAEVTNTNNFAAFTSDGFTVGNGSQTNAANPPETHVAWTWDAGESNTSITAGSLNSTAYNTDRVWSNGIANSNSDFDQAKTNAFNGNRSNMLRTGGNQVLVTLNFSPALTVSNSIEILGEGWPTAGATFVFTVDGSTTTRTTSQGRPATFNVSGSLTRITMQNVSSNGRTYLTYIKVDGKELIDSNITPPNIPLIASTVRANQSAGFSIVSYEGNNTGGATIGHGLNAQPKFIVVKDRDSTSGWWAVYHDGVGAGKGGYLNDGQAFSAQSHWSYSDPSSSVFYVGANANTNANQNDFIAYCFAPVEGYSAFGSYTGNGSADGPFIYTGFRPRWLMIKSSSNSGEDWLLLDTSRDPSNTATSTAMYASQRHQDNATNAITTDILSNGFKCIGTNAAINASGYTYIYHAFAEHPFKTARAR